MTQVSSAYNKVKNYLETLHMSFIYKINKSGPRIEPWQESCLTFSLAGQSGQPKSSLAGPQ